MFDCSVLVGVFFAFGIPSGSISSGLPLISLAAFSRSRDRVVKATKRNVADARDDDIFEHRLETFERDRQMLDRILVLPEISFAAGVPDDDCRHVGSGAAFLRGDLEILVNISAVSCRQLRLDLLCFLRSKFGRLAQSNNDASN